MWAVMDTAVLSHSTVLLCCGLLVIYRASGKDCNTDEISLAMMSCQEEREILSDASRVNDTSQLCQALQKYSECIGPKIMDCKGEALLAFNVIRQQYAAAPYHCHITDTWSEKGMGPSENDVNSQLHNEDDDNHVISDSLQDDPEGMTESVLPNPTGKMRKKQLALDADTTPINTVAADQGNSIMSSKAAPSLHDHHPVLFFTAAALAFAIIVRYMQFSVVKL